MKACVFVGPTLAVDKARAVCPGVILLPPARQGDVYRVATHLRPDAIGIVDGFFSHVPSVWHKEILYAISEGIAVYGSASMGALRAAELGQFGMIGIGRIFEAYRDGVLEPYEAPFEDDDEVAVLHGPQELSYLALSEALVNIRCTFARAANEDIIKSATRDILVKSGKGLFYQQRSYDAILDRAPDGVEAGELKRLRAWLPGGKVDQKRADAIAMLRTLEAMAPAHDGARFVLAETTMWVRAKAVVDTEQVQPAIELDELRLQGAPYFAARARALDRLLDADQDSPDGADDSRLESDAPVPAAASRARELLADRVPAALLERHILAELRATGTARTLRQRAEEKRERLARLRFPPPIATADLLVWYFGRLRAGLPADLEDYARRLDFATLDAFHSSIFDEYLFLMVTETSE